MECVLNISPKRGHKYLNATVSVSPLMSMCLVLQYQTKTWVKMAMNLFFFLTHDECNRKPYSGSSGAESNPPKTLVSRLCFIIVWFLLFIIPLKALDIHNKYTGASFAAYITFSSLQGC